MSSPLLIFTGIIFKLPEETISSLPSNIDYTIRMNIENVMRTDRARNPFWVKDAFISSTKTQRYSRGFVYLQESIEKAIIEMQTGKADGPAVQMQAFPYPCYYKDEWVSHKHMHTERLIWRLRWSRKRWHLSKYTTFTPTLNICSVLFIWNNSSRMNV